MANTKQTQFNWRGLLDRVTYHTKQIIRPVHPAAVQGMGAIPHENGTTFRVWAPYAQKVFVSGTFNDWSQWKSPLAAERNGYWSATIAEAKAGDEYKFLIHNNHKKHLRTDPYARDVAPGRSNSVIANGTFDWGSAAAASETDTDASFRMSPWHELIIYELHVGTFEENPQNIIGTFQGVIDKLPYLQELGINCIELMPVKEFEGDYSWGYNPAHPFAITRTYGGRTMLKKLIKAAHEHGIAVIVDVVYNHFGPQDLHLWQFDGWHKDGKGGIYFYNDWRSSTPWADTRPDYGRAEVRRYIRDNVFMWLEEYQVDGLRWDATSYIRNAHGHDGDPGADIAEGWQLMREINDEIKERFPGRINIAEDLQSNAWVTKETEEGGAGFDAQWDARFVHPIRDAIITPNDDERDMLAVAEAIQFRYNPDAFERIIYTESHDEVANGKARVPEEITPGNASSYYAKKRSILGAALTFTTPGIPMIFQGQEFLEDGWFDDHDPLDWSKTTQHRGIRTLYRDLIHLRRNGFGETRGLTGQHVNVHHINNALKVIAYHRWEYGGPGDDVVIVANFANRAIEGYTIGFPRPGIWRVRLNSDVKEYDKTFQEHLCPDVIAATAPDKAHAFDGLSCFGNISIGPYSVLIFSQDPLTDTAA